MDVLVLGALLVAATSAAPPDSVELYDDLGDHHVAITTEVPLAQQYFDQGVRLTYAFNHAEAIRAFEEAARLDPECAMCAWGIALAYGPNINAPMDSAAAVAAWNAIEEARARIEGESEKEVALIEALASRYAAIPPAERSALDSAYAEAMEGVFDRYPEDPDVAALYAESMMDLSPWNYWTPAGEPRPDTGTILGILEAVLTEHPDHPGACHFYIHAVEAVHPEKAVPCAERLAALMPGAGHIVHMPAHIYIRVGRYADAIESNQHAVHTDQTFLADRGPTGIYTGFYYPHNYHFLSFAAMLAGQSQAAIEAARATAETMPIEIASAVPDGQRLDAQSHLILAAFGRWEDVLAEPMPAPELRLANGYAQYARGVSLAALGRISEAEAALDSVQQIAAAYDPAAGWPKTVLEIATHVLMGEIAARQGATEDAVTHFEVAVELQDGLTYTEPPYWPKPVRHKLGAALLADGRGAEAEAVYRADLAQFPENGWALYGLAESLEAQGKSAEAAEVRDRLTEAWRTADVTLAASSF